MNKRALFIPLPEYGHIIPTLKLAKKLVADGWKVDYLVYEEFNSFLQDQNMGVIVEKSRRIAPYHDTHWVCPTLDEANVILHKNIDGINDYDVFFIDTYVSYCALTIKDCKTKCYTYFTNADCESYKSPPLCFYIETNFVRNLPGLSKLLWFRIWKSRYGYNRVLMDLGLKEGPPNRKEALNVKKKIVREIKKQRVAMFPSQSGSVALNLNSIVFGSRALSQEHLPKERYLGFCLDDAGISAAGTFDEFIETQKMLTYCSFGSMNARYDEALKILESVIEAFKGGELGGLLLQAGSYYERLAKYEAPNVKIVSSCNQKKILSSSHYAITHGGYGTQKECVRYGVPMIVIPLFVDQFHNATTVARLGIGRVVRKKNANAKSIQNAMMELMGKNIYKERLSAIYSEHQDEHEFEQGYRFLLERMPESSEVSIQTKTEVRSTATF